MPLTESADNEKFNAARDMLIHMCDDIDEVIRLYERGIVDDQIDGDMKLHIFFNMAAVISASVSFIVYPDDDGFVYEDHLNSPNTPNHCLSAVDAHHSARLFAAIGVFRAGIQLWHEKKPANRHPDQIMPRLLRNYSMLLDALLFKDWRSLSAPMAIIIRGS